MVQVVLWWKITLCVCEWLVVEHVLPMLCRDPGQLELGTTRHSHPVQCLAGMGSEPWQAVTGCRGAERRQEASSIGPRAFSAARLGGTATTWGWCHRAGAAKACQEASAGASICVASSPAKKREMALLFHSSGSHWGPH